MFHWKDHYNELTGEEIQQIYKGYCEWCWGYKLGGNCDVCKEAFNKKMEGLQDVGKD